MTTIETLFGSAHAMSEPFKCFSTLYDKPKVILIDESQLEEKAIIDLMKESLITMFGITS